MRDYGDTSEATSQKFAARYGRGSEWFAQMFAVISAEYGRSGRIFRIDNYYARDDGLFADGAGVGDVADGAVYNHKPNPQRGLLNPNEVGEQFFKDEGATEVLRIQNNHSGVQQWYRWTIDPNSSWFTQYNGEFQPFCEPENQWDTSRVQLDSSLNPCERGWNISILNDEGLPFPATNGRGLFFVYDPVILDGVTPYGCEYNADSRTVSCVEQSSPYLNATVNIPTDATAIEFEYRFPQKGDGDYAAVMLDDIPVWTSAARDTVGAGFVGSGALPVDSKDEPRKLTIVLYGVGAKNAAFELRNLRASRAVDAPKDTSPPAISPIVSGTLGTGEWYTGDIDVNWAVTDAESSISSRDGCDRRLVMNDTAGTEFACEATSEGGTASVIVTIKRDATQPTLIFGTPSPAANASGWHTGGVEIPFVAEDATSGVAATSASSPVLVSMQGSGITQTVTVTDNAGNSATFTTPAVNIDGTGPAVSIASPSDGASYLKNGQLIAGYSCSDSVSGIVKCEGTVPNGASIDTSTEGDFSLRVSAEDLAGNSNSRTHRYSVVMRYSFGGFWSPVDNPPTVNTVKAGRTLPIKWSLMSDEGQYASDLSTFRSLTSQSVACLSGAPMDAIEELSTSGSSGLRYDGDSQQFVYNWKTSSAWAGTCRRLVLDLSDGQRREAMFRLQ